jgi:WD40 repeat protein
MAAEPSDRAPAETLNAVLAAYLGAVDAGATPERQALLDRHPALANELRAFFAAQDQLDRLCLPVRLALSGGDPRATPRGVADTETLDLSRQAAAPAAAPESTVPGYEILGELGRGGMGVVYKARHVALKRVVALKMILAGAYAGPDELARFQTEAEAVARLQHPNVVQIHEVGTHQGRPYLALEFCGGGTLEQRLRQAPLTPRAAAALVEVLARAMHAAHTRGVVHRDLKPANVLLAEDGTPRVTDFGLAKQLDAAGQTRTGAVVGTPSYMAPEQAAGQGHQVGAAADVYALGAILYECLTGRPPFKAATPLDTILQVLRDEPVPPSRLQPKVPRDLETVCLKCLHKDLARRYGSAAALAEDLRRFQAGESVAARPAGAAERLAKWVRRRPTTAALVAVSVAAALALLGVGLHFTRLLAEERNDALQKKTLAETNETKAVTQKLETDREWRRAEKGESDARKQKTLADERADNLARQLQLTRCSEVTAHLMRVAPMYERDPLTALEMLNDVRLFPLDLRDAAWGFYERACRRWEHTLLQGHKDHICALAFSPDGKTLASAGWFRDRTVILWDAQTGRKKTVLPHDRLIKTVAFSPDGKTLASAGVPSALADDRSGFLKLWDVATGKEKTSLSDDHVWAVTFSPDGKTLVSANDDKTMKLWDVATGKLKATLQGHTGNVLDVAVTRDGKTLASCGMDGTIKLWDLNTRQELATLRGHPGWVRSVAFSHDDKTLAAGGDAPTLKLWDVATRRETIALEGHADTVPFVAFSRADNTLASVGRDGLVKLWDVARAREKVSLNCPVNPGDVAFSPDGKWLATGHGDGSVRVWNVKREQHRATLAGHTGKIWAAAASRGGTLLATASEDLTVKLWDLPTGRLKATLQGHTGEVQTVAFSPDDTTLATTAEHPDGTVKLWDVQTGKEKRALKVAGTAHYSVAFSPDGKTLATGAYNRVILWDVATGQQLGILKGSTSSFYSHWSVAFSPDGKTLAVADGTVKLWDVATGKLKAPLPPHGRASSVAFSPDGQTLAHVGEHATVHLWDVAKGQERVTLRGHTEGSSQQICNVTFSPDGKVLATASQDEAILWDVATGQRKATIPGGFGPVAFSGDGKVFAWANDTTVKLWDLAP